MRALLEALLLAVLAAAVAVTLNASRAEKLPARLPEAFYHLESGARPALLPQARRLFDEGKTVFLDARSREKFERGQIDGALNVPFDRWREIYPNLGGWIEGRKVVLYADRSGTGDADDLAGALAARGHARDSLFVYLGGFEEWRDSGLPVSAGPDRVLGEEGSADEEDWRDEPAERDTEEAP